MTDELQPLWFRLPKRFYRKLSIIADKAGLQPEKALEEAVDVFGALVLAAEGENLQVNDFISQMRPLLRAWQKEAANRGVNLSQAVEDGAKLFHLNGPINPEKDASKETIRNSPAGLAILRWSKVSASERSEHARKLAQKRWGKKREKRDKAVGEHPAK